MQLNFSRRKNTISKGGGAFYCVQISIDSCMKDGSGLGGDGDDLELPGVENLLSNMETQTQDDLLLCINSCTQTGKLQLYTDRYATVYTDR